MEHAEVVDASEVRNLVALLSGTHRLSPSERLRNLVVPGFLFCLVLPFALSLVVSGQTSALAIFRRPISTLTFIVAAGVAATWLLEHVLSVWSFSSSFVRKASPFALASWSIPVASIAGITFDHLHGSTVLVLRPYVGKSRRVALISSMQEALGGRGA